MKKYYFDFCGTLIKEQTHEQIKFFCREKKYFSYFIKIFIPKSYKIKFDCYYLKTFNLYSDFSMWLVSNCTPSISLSILKNLVDANQSVKILTLADKIVVEKFLKKYLNISNIHVEGSSVKNILSGELKAEILKKESDTVFFTDSMMDLCAIKAASNVVISEFCTPSMKKYAIKNKYIFAGDYE